MKQRDTRVTRVKIAALVGGLLGLGAVPGAAQPVPQGEAAAPAGPAAAASPEAAKPAAGPAAKPATEAAAKPEAAKPAAGDASKTAKPGTPLPDGSSIKVERTASGAKLFRITEGLLVEGQKQRPNAFLVLQRATVDYDYEALAESFLPRILTATREKPF